MPWGSLHAMHARNSRLIQSAQFSLYVLSKSNHCCCHGQFTCMQGTAVCSIQHSFSLFDLTESNHCCHGQVCVSARNGRLLQSTQFFTVWPDWSKPLLPSSWLEQTVAVAVGKCSCREQLFISVSTITSQHSCHCGLTEANCYCCQEEVCSQRAAVCSSQPNVQSVDKSKPLSPWKVCI